MTLIEILGPGCANCERLHRNVQQAVRELGLECEIEKVTDLNVIAGYRVAATPALVVDGRIRLTGRVPSVEELKTLLG